MKKKKQRVKKAGGINKALELHISLLKKNLTRAIFLLASTANMFGTSRFFNG